MNEIEFTNKLWGAIDNIEYNCAEMLSPHTGIKLTIGDEQFLISVNKL